MGRGGGPGAGQGGVRCGRHAEKVQRTSRPEQPSLLSARWAACRAAATAQKVERAHATVSLLARQPTSGPNARLQHSSSAAPVLANHYRFAVLPLSPSPTILYAVFAHVLVGVAAAEGAVALLPAAGRPRRAGGRLRQAGGTQGRWAVGSTPSYGEYCGKHRPGGCWPRAGALRGAACHRLQPRADVFCSRSRIWRYRASGKMVCTRWTDPVEPHVGRGAQRAAVAAPRPLHMRDAAACSRGGVGAERGQGRGRGVLGKAQLAVGGR